MSEGVQFAHMKFRAEEKGMNASALKVSGEGVEFSADVRKVAFVQFWDNDATAFDTDLEAADFDGDGAQ